ncbi:hypothetical protein ACLB2K_064594 [Fragaria x ananassa]
MVVLDISRSYFFTEENLEIPTLHMLVENLTELRELHLGSVQISAGGSEWCQAISSSLPNLRVLSLSGCNLSGPFHDSLAKLRSLSVIQLDSNNISAPVPTLFDNFSNLTSLDLAFCNLQGTFPKEIFQLPSLRSILKSMANLTQLVSLKMYGNKFEGSIPSFNGAKNLEEIDLSSNGLTGQLRTFPHFLRNQSKLGWLDLSDNQIQGNIPNWIWRFRDLERLNLSCNSLETLEGPTINLTSLETLDLHSNQLHGKIPISLSPNMYYLDYSRNNFSTNIPTAIGDMLLNIQYFSLSSNNLQGIIPGSICNSHKLEVLDMSNNSLSGTVPHCLTTTSTLSVLNLRRNNLTSVDKLSRNCSLRTLDISENQIQGLFPKSLINCLKVEVLNLGKNQIPGPFPFFLKNTTTLRVLILRSNRFYGSIGCPKTNGTWPMLQIVDFADNNFSGNVPRRALTTWKAMMTNKLEAQSKLNQLQFQDDVSSGIYYQNTIKVIVKGNNTMMVEILGVFPSIKVTIKGNEIELVKILTTFTSIDFSCNKFNGSIPDEIGEFNALVYLNLSNNAFTCTIPSSLSNLSQLGSLDLSQNTLSGQIPPQLTKLTFLSVLNLSNNQLEGRIPSSNQFTTFPKSSFEGNKGLFGPPLTEEDKTRLSPPEPEKNHPNSGDEIDWNVISVEIGFTCGLGLSIGSLMFCKRWRIWYYRTMYRIIVRVFPQVEQRFGRHRRHVYIGESYCECFAAGLYCVEPCSCFNCFNKSIHVEIVHETRRLIELRDPLAFAPRVVGSTEPVSQYLEETNSTPTSARHKRGCNCKKSSCLKKYCVCFQGGAGCSLQCKCVGCKNTYGQKGGQSLSGGLGAEDTEIEGESGVHEKNDPMILSEICRPPPGQVNKFLFILVNHDSYPRLEKHLQAIPEDETFEALDRPKTSQPSSICVKSASPNSKRVSPPHSHNSISKFGSLKSWKGGRKLTLRSVPNHVHYLIRNLNQLEPDPF